MKTRISIAMMLFFTVVIPARSSAVFFEIARAGKATKNDVEVVVTMPSAFKGVEPVEMMVKLSNASQKILHWTASGDELLTLGIKVVGSKHNFVPLTKFAENAISTPPMMKGGAQLAPGKSFEWKIPLDKYFLFVPGKYAVSVAFNKLSFPPDFAPFSIFASGMHFQIK